MTGAEIFLLVMGCVVVSAVVSFIIGLQTGKNKKTVSEKPGQFVQISDSKEAIEKNLPEMSCGVMKLQNVDDPTAAMIMAIVSDESGIPLSELQFKSIKIKY